MSRRLSLYVLALGTIFFWGISFPLTKIALEHLGPTALAFLRWAISAIVLLPWLHWSARGRAAGGLTAAARLLRERWRTVAWVSLTGITLFYFLENTAIRYTTATNAGVLANLTSVFMVLIATLLLRERLAALEWGGMAAAFAGSVLVSQGAGHLTLGGPGLLGDGLMIVASFFGAVYSIGGKQLTGRYPPEVVMTVIAVAGALQLLPLALIEGLTLDMPLATWGVLLVLGVLCGALANVWWMSLLARTAASRAALALFLIPVVAAGLSVALLDEPLSWLLAAGAVLVLGGVVLVQRRAPA